MIRMSRWGYTFWLLYEFGCGLLVGYGIWGHH